jgi:peptidyl-prolyl cis-trans isomerase SurA
MKLKPISKVQKKANKIKFPHLMLALLYACILCAAAVPSGVIRAQEPAVVDRIVAVVNNDIITLFDLNRAFRPFEENIKALKYDPEKERQTLFKVRKDLLSQLIDSHLADQEAKRDQINVSEKEIDTAIERIKETRSFTDEQLREGLAIQGLTMEEYRNEIKEQILRTKLVNREVKSKVVITNEDIKNYYDRHKEKYAGEKKFYLWNIFVKLPSIGDTHEKEDALRQMEAIMVELKQGRPFETLVNELNESSSPVGGTDLGLYRLEELSEHLQKVVEKMKAGEFSTVLETDFGYQILYVQKIQETPAKTLDEVDSEIQQILYSEYVDNKYQEWLDELRERSHIRIVN